MQTKTLNNITDSFNLTLDTYGDLSYLFKLQSDNTTTIPTLLSDLNEGDVINYDDTYTVINASNVTQLNTSLSATPTYYYVKENQSIWDLALQLYGDITQVFKLIQDNLFIDSVSNTHLVGYSIIYDKQQLALTEYFDTNNIFLATGTGDNSRSFDDSFDFSFN